jgi:selenide,water dikinase
MNTDKIRLTKFSQHAGCGAKLGPCALSEALTGVKNVRYENVLADFAHSEDAGIILINKELALVQTVDFFPPIVNDPYTFGQIAAANALSDVYAMGAKPLSALSVVGFPIKTLDIKVLGQMTNGALSKLNEANCALLGGHSVEDEELKYGFAVTGTIHPDKILYNRGGKAGDVIILTKPLGSGLVNTAMRVDQASQESIDAFIKVMTRLNKRAAEIIENYSVSACTDVTGFGLFGHLYEMIDESDTGAVVTISKIRMIPGAEKYAAEGFIPGGAYNNRDFCEKHVDVDSNVPEELVDVLYDPQTSGGLIFMIKSDQVLEVMKELENDGIEASQVGYLTDEHPNRIKVVKG